MLARNMASSSVCLLKRQNVGSRKQRHTIAQGL